MAKEKKKDFKSDWAYSEKHGKNIHISDAESGLKGFRCLGCHAQMVANIQKKNPNWLSYFSHHATDVNKEKIECVRASQVYREKIARTILNELKYVNAPAIYKYPPLDSDENLFPMKIESRRKIEAAYTKAELSFYENEDGVIEWGKNRTITDKDLLIRPDVTFFNKDNKPILFIEFIVYSKIKPDKFLKLSRLGIDTLQINIPRKSEADIEKALKSSRTYKWVYNEKEANTEYIPIFRKDTEDLSQINDNDRIFFEEDFRCRQTEINWLIRSVKRNLQSEQYRTTELGLNQQIQKVERNTEIENQRLGDLEESNRRVALARNSNEEDQEDKEYAELERRYFAEKRRLEDAIYNASVDQKFRSELIENIRIEEEEIKRIEREEIDFETEIRERVQNKFSGSIRREKEEIDSLEETIRDSFDREILATERIITTLGISYNDIPREVSERFRYKEAIISSRIKSTREKNKDLERALSNEFEGKIKFEESEIKRIKRETAEFLEISESEKERIRKEEGNIEESARKEFNREIESNARELSKEFTNLLEVQRVGNNYQELKLLEKRYKSARKFLSKRTWEKE
ncbi:hypothetical protein [Polaribacter atrinae]|uniref:Uncharacterized protein n=1 Tax=Polaribacter atrinae TaxID=1333662 RepID=A0A176T6F7_9FLAO|nr:hypothetical protein [Polaribacter atrinae]OAD42955.1 hypothetical protein LPB303_13850 [Polaribacter atrinae]